MNLALTLIALERWNWIHFKVKISMQMTALIALIVKENHGLVWLHILVSIQFKTSEMFWAFLCTRS